LLARSNASYSASDKRSRPTLFCSALDSAVRPAARWVLLARSGCALIRVNRSSDGARSTAIFIAENSALTPANGRAAAACCAIHGEYSKILASAATKSSLLHALRSERLSCDIRPSPIQAPARWRQDAQGQCANAARFAAASVPTPGHGSRCSRETASAPPLVRADRRSGNADRPTSSSVTSRLQRRVRRSCP